MKMPRRSHSRHSSHFPVPGTIYAAVQKMGKQNSMHQKVDSQMANYRAPVPGTRRSFEENTNTADSSRNQWAAAAAQPPEMGPNGRWAAKTAEGQ